MDELLDRYKRKEITTEFEDKTSKKIKIYILVSGTILMLFTYLSVFLQKK